MSIPQDQLQQQPPPVATTHDSYSTHTGHGSIGQVIAVLIVIIILGVIAGVIGRLCSSRRIMDNGQYDFESWVEHKCSSCIDGGINDAPPRGPNISTGSIPLSNPIQTHQQMNQDKQSTQDPPAKFHS